jgi:hypothetical protein
MSSKGKAKIAKGKAKTSKAKVSPKAKTAKSKISKAKTVNVKAAKGKAKTIKAKAKVSKGKAKTSKAKVPSKAKGKVVSAKVKKVVTLGKGYINYIVLEDIEYVTKEMMEEIYEDVNLSNTLEMLFVRNNSEYDSDVEMFRPNEDVVTNIIQTDIVGNDDYGLQICIRSDTAENSEMDGIKRIIQRVFMLVKEADGGWYNVQNYKVRIETEDSENLPLREILKINASKMTAPAFRVLLQKKEFGVTTQESMDLDNTSQDQIDKLVAKKNEEAFEKRTFVEKLTAPLHDVRTHNADYIAIGAYALLDDDNVNKSDLHVTVDQIKKILKDDKIELAFVDIASHDDNPSDHSIRLKKEIEKLQKGKDKKQYVNIKKAFETISHSKKYSIGGFGGQVVCFKSNWYGPAAMLHIMNILAKGRERTITKGAPYGISTFSVYNDMDETGVDEDDHRGGSLNHNVTYLSYSS